MCLPVATMALAASAVQMVGQATSTVFAMQQAGYEARAANQNARIESERANDARERGQTENLNYQRQVSQEMGTQQASMAANGVDPTFGSAAYVRGDTAMIGAEDVRTISRNTFQEMRGFDINAASFRAEAKAARRRKTGFLIQGGLAMAGTALGAAQQYRKFSRPTG